MTSVLLLDESKIERNMFVSAEDKSGGAVHEHDGVPVHLDVRYGNCQADDQHGFRTMLKQETTWQEAHQSSLATTRVVMAALCSIVRKITVLGRL